MNYCSKNQYSQAEQDPEHRPSAHHRGRENNPDHSHGDDTGSLPGRETGSNGAQAERKTEEDPHTASPRQTAEAHEE